MRFLTLLTTLALMATPLATARLVVGNVRAAQRSATRLVDIDYDITGITSEVTVLLDISADGGTTWVIPATTLTGAAGDNVTPGSNLRITWDAGVDWPNQQSTQTRFRIQVADMTTVTDLTRIPTGSFTMGDALDGNSNASSHTVSVSTFFIQQKEVSKTQWGGVRDWGLLNGYTKLAAGASKAATHPIEKVTWYDVVKWCNAKSEMEGLTPCYYTDAAQTVVYRTGNTDLDNTMVNWNADGYRLPTEAEWEKAARGGLSGKRFPWGDTIAHSQANYYSSKTYTYDVSLTRGSHPIYGKGLVPYTAPVGSFAANGYGLYDMAGNVREWCWDRYDAAYYGSAPALDPHGPTVGSNRVLRGGDWSYYATGCRVADRNSSNLPSATYNKFGFRIVRAYLVTAESSNTTVDTREWLLTTSALSNGTITGIATGGKYLNGSTATLTAVPAAGYAFTSWTGAATGTTNPLSVLMDANKTIGASFSPNTSDADSDGLSAYLEVLTYGTNPALADTDGDGLSDGYEAGVGRFSLIAGTFTWPQARADAQARGGELASFPTEARWNRAMESLGAGAIDNYTGLWIGASDATTEGTWTWVNGAAFAFNLWASNRPSALSGNTLDYAEVSGGNGGEPGKWYDRSPTVTRDGYILESGYATDPTKADSDGDGFGDGFEVSAGFNPILATSTPDLLTSIRTVPAAVPATVELRFNAAMGVSYRIEASTDLNTWNLSEPNIIGQGGVITRSYSVTSWPQRFFRVRRN